MAQTLKLDGFKQYLHLQQKSGPRDWVRLKLLVYSKKKPRQPFGHRDLLLEEAFENQQLAPRNLSVEHGRDPFLPGLPFLNKVESIVCQNDGTSG